MRSHTPQCMQTCKRTFCTPSTHLCTRISTVTLISRRNPSPCTCICSCLLMQSCHQPWLREYSWPSASKQGLHHRPERMLHLLPLQPEQPRGAQRRQQCHPGISSLGTLGCTKRHPQQRQR